MLVRLQPDHVFTFPVAYLFRNDMFSPPFTISVFTALPDRPLQWTTSSTRAQDATSWRCHRRTTMTSSTWTSRILCWVQTICGWTLCVALSRAIWFLTVL